MKVLVEYEIDLDNFADNIIECRKWDYAHNNCKTLCYNSKAELLQYLYENKHFIIIDTNCGELDLSLLSDNAIIDLVKKAYKSIQDELSCVENAWQFYN